MMGSRKPGDDELRTRFAYALAAARDEGISLTDNPLDADTTGAVTAVADAYPDPSAELIAAAEVAFAGMLDGTNAQRHGNARKIRGRRCDCRTKVERQSRLETAAAQRHP